MWNPHRFMAARVEDRGKPNAQVLNSNCIHCAVMWMDEGVPYILADLDQPEFINYVGTRVGFTGEFASESPTDGVIHRITVVVRETHRTRERDALDAHEIVNAAQDLLAAARKQDR